MSHPYRPRFKRTSIGHVPVDEPKPRYRCQHVQAGYLVAARVEIKNALIDMCAACHRDGYHSMMMTDENPITQEC